MEEIDLKKIMNDKSPGLIDKYPKIIREPALAWINGMFRVKKINSFIRKTQNDYGFDFIDKLFLELKSKIAVSETDLENIPKEGPVIIVSNHPLGALDGLGIVKAVSNVRPDVKIVVNDILSNLTNLKDLFLPIDLYGTKSQRANLMNITSHIKSGKAIIFFPAGIVSRMKALKVMDTTWTKGAVSFGRKFNAPIVCGRINNTNSMLFYLVTKIKDGFAPFLFPREMFNFVRKELKVNFGKAISPSVYDEFETDSTILNLLRQYTYNIGEPPKELVKHLEIRSYARKDIQ